MVTCDFCKGQGKVICMICDGEKEYEVKEDCLNCRNGRISCYECEGEGNIVCQNCNSSGMILNPCQICGGSGLKLLWKYL
jgi:RecJ-like exonuclease